jgi:hypothetical protein
VLDLMLSFGCCCCFWCSPDVPMAPTYIVARHAAVVPVAPACKSYTCTLH